MERGGQNLGTSAKRAGTAVYISGLDSIESLPFGSLITLTDNGTARDLIWNNFQMPALCCAFDSPFSPALASLFASFRLSIIPTRENSSEMGAIMIARACRSAALSVNVIVLPGLGVRETVAEWIHRGGTRAQLLDLIARTPDYQPSVVALSEQQLSLKPVLQPDSLTEILHDPELEVEGIVAFNRILDAVKCPAYCRAYPLAVMSAFAETFDAGRSFEGFQTSAPTIGGYLPGKPSGKKLSRDSLRKRSIRAESLFNRWQQSSGYSLILRRRDSDLSAAAQSVYSTPLIVAWRRVLDSARQNPRWAEGKRKRAQAIRHAAAQIVGDLLTAPAHDVDQPPVADASALSKSESSGSGKSGMTKLGEAPASILDQNKANNAQVRGQQIDDTPNSLNCAGLDCAGLNSDALDSEHATPSNAPISVESLGSAANALDLDHSKSARMIRRSFKRIASRLPRKPLRRRSEPALRASEIALSESKRLAQQLIQMTMAEFAGIVAEINRINSITGSNLSSDQLFSSIMEPFVTGQLVPPQNSVNYAPIIQPDAFRDWTASPP